MKQIFTTLLLIGTLSLSSCFYNEPDDRVEFLVTEDANGNLVKNGYDNRDYMHLNNKIISIRQISKDTRIKPKYKPEYIKKAEYEIKTYKDGYPYTMIVGEEIANFYRGKDSIVY